MELISSIIATAISFAALAFSAYTYAVSVRNERKRDTLDAFNRLQNEVLDKLNTYTKKQIEEIIQNPRSTEYKELSTLLARLEHFAVGVNEKVYDRAIVKKTAAAFLVPLYENKLAMVVEKKRAMSPTGRHYADLEDMISGFKGKQDKLA